MTCFVICVVAFFLSANGAFALSAQSAATDLQVKADDAAAGGRYDEARKLYLRALNLLLVKGQLADAGSVYSQLGEINQVHGVFPAAESYYKKSLDLLKRYAPPNDLRLVSAMDGLGWMYITWGRLADGSRLMDEAQTRGDRAQPNDPRLIRHLDSQAAYLVVLGKYSEAQRDWNRALEIGKVNYGPDGQQYANILVHLGQASSLYGDYAAAARMFRRYLKIEDQAPGPPTISRAVAESELARVYTNLHQFSEARPWFDEALFAFRNNPDEAPLAYSMALSYLGDYYMAREAWSNARRQYQQALNIQQGVLGENHAVVASMLSLSKALKKLHLKSEAKDLVAQARAIAAAERNPLQDQTVDVLALSRH
jgi:tetratricopeptide (TPR) repeat protein